MGGHHNVLCHQMLAYIPDFLDFSIFFIAVLIYLTI